MRTRRRGADPPPEAPASPIPVPWERAVDGPRSKSGVHPGDASRKCGCQSPCSPFRFALPCSSPGPVLLRKASRQHSLAFQSTILKLTCNRATRAVSAAWPCGGRQTPLLRRRARSGMAPFWATARYPMARSRRRRHRPLLPPNSRPRVKHWLRPWRRGRSTRRWTRHSTLRRWSGGCVASSLFPGQGARGRSGCAKTKVCRQYSAG